MRANGVNVDDRAKNIGGTQRIELKDNEGRSRSIPLNFDDHIMTVDLREPSEEELMALRVIWVLPPMANITPQSFRQSRKLLEDHHLETPGEFEPVTQEEQTIPLTTTVLNTKKGQRTVEEWKQ